MNQTLPPPQAPAAACLRRQTDWAALRVTGPDRAGWLEGLVTCSVVALRPSTGAFGLLLTRQGKIQAPVWVVCVAECLWLLTLRGSRQAVFEQLDQRMVMEDAELALDDGYCWFSAHGPNAQQEAGALVSALGGMCAQLPVCQAGDAVVGVPMAQSEAGFKGLALAELDDAGWELLRIRAELPQFGLDYGPEDRPHEAGLDRRAVDWTKGCYLGQEVVCMQDLRGKVKRRVRSFAIELAPGVSAPVAPVLLSTADAAKVGAITSLIYDPAAEHFVGLGKVELQAVERDGAQLQLQASGSSLAAKVQLLAEAGGGRGPGQP